METRSSKRHNASNALYAAANHDTSDEVALRGLVNLGCTCYINCVLQVLVHTPTVSEFCRSDDDDDAVCHVTPTECLLCQLSRVVRELRSLSYTPLSVPSLLRALWSVEPEFADGGMHDAHDFWLLAVDAFEHHAGGAKLMQGLLKSELLTTLRCERCGYMSSIDETVVDLSLPLQTPPVALEAPRDEASSCRESSTTSPTDETETQSQPTTPERRTRKHALRRCGSCASCANPKKKKGCLRNKRLKGLSAESYAECVELGVSEDVLQSVIQRETQREKSLEQCLQEAYREEIVHHWMCPECRTLRNAVKETSVLQFPELLAVHFKRFDFNSRTRRSKKLGTHVTCPEVLDLTAFSAIPPSRTLWNYHLVAIIAHRGTLNGGHFWTYLLKNDQWFKMNDAVVKAVALSEVQASQAYMVFYEKRLLHNQE